MLNKKMLTYKTKALVRKRQVAHQSTSYDKVQSIGVIFTIEDLNKHEAVKKLIRNLEADGKQVHALAYLPKDRENYEFLFEFFTLKDINFWGNFTADQVLSFAEKPFDYLFYADQTSNPLIRYILAKSKARCRIGKFDELNRQFCEMMIKVQNDNIHDLVDEMYKYTKILC